MITLTQENWWKELRDLGPDFDIITSAISSHLNNTIAPRIQRLQYDRLIDEKAGPFLKYHDGIFILTFIPFNNVPDGSDGRLKLSPFNLEIFKERTKEVVNKIVFEMIEIAKINYEKETPEMSFFLAAKEILLDRLFIDVFYRTCQRMANNTLAYHETQYENKNVETINR